MYSLNATPLNDIVLWKCLISYQIFMFLNDSKTLDKIVSASNCKSTIKVPTSNTMHIIFLCQVSDVKLFEIKDMIVIVLPLVSHPLKSYFWVL